jgi:large subunit ribosomal protein L29
MKTRELRNLDIDELRAKEREFREDEFKLRFKHASGQLDKTARLKQLRKDIARVMTLMREKETSS